jgi:hypothetical protein
MMTNGGGAPRMAESEERVLPISGRPFPRLPRLAYVLSTLLAVVAAIT